MDNAEPALGVMNDSGFPLQLAVQRAVSAGSDTHGWVVYHAEHAWRNAADERSGFIDLVLRDRNGYGHLVVECKRVRDATWVFFSSEGSAAPRRHCKAWITHYNGHVFGAVGWRDFAFDPATPEAHYCAIRGQSDKERNTLLERVGSEVVSATEALAVQERDHRPEGQPSTRLFFNVLITTAALKFAEFDVDDLSLDDGTLSNAQIREVPYLRMRKQFSARPPVLTQEQWQFSGPADRQMENTLFVVQARHINEFLAAIDLPDPAGVHLIA